jgi:hypothetical protein
MEDSGEQVSINILTCGLPSENSSRLLPHYLENKKQFRFDLHFQFPNLAMTSSVFQAWDVATDRTKGQLGSLPAKADLQI